MLQAVSHQLCTKCLPKLPQPVQSVAAKHDKRIVARPAPKARDAVERNLERRHAYVSCGLTGHPNDVFTGVASLIKKKQRDMQAIRLDEIAKEVTRAFDDLSQAINACC